MANRKDGSGKDDSVRKSYQNLGTFRTAQKLVQHRGWMGLYSGFHLHLREHNPATVNSTDANFDIWQFETLLERVFISLRTRVQSNFWQMLAEVLLQPL